LSRRRFTLSDGISLAVTRDGGEGRFVSECVGCGWKPRRVQFGLAASNPMHRCFHPRPAFTRPFGLGGGGVLGIAPIA